MGHGDHGRVDAHAQGAVVAVSTTARSLMTKPEAASRFDVLAGDLGMPSRYTSPATTLAPKATLARIAALAAAS